MLSLFPSLHLAPSHTLLPHPLPYAALPIALKCLACGQCLHALP